MPDYLDVYDFELMPMMVDFMVECLLFDEHARIHGGHGMAEHTGDRCVS